MATDSEAKEDSKTAKGEEKEVDAEGDGTVEAESQAGALCSLRLSAASGADPIRPFDH